MISVDRKIELAGITKNLKHFREFTRQCVTQADVSEEVAWKLTLAVDEAVTSIIRSQTVGLKTSQILIQDIELHIDINEVRFKAVISESEKEFHYDEDDFDKLLEEAKRLRKYDLSTFMLCRVMDEVNYEFKKGYANQLTVIKFL